MHTENFDDHNARSHNQRRLSLWFEVDVRGTECNDGYLMVGSAQVGGRSSVRVVGQMQYPQVGPRGAASQPARDALASYCEPEHAVCMAAFEAMLFG